MLAMKTTNKKFARSNPAIAEHLLDVTHPFSLNKNKAAIESERQRARRRGATKSRGAR
jgi:hypothetical protein